MQNIDLFSYGPERKAPARVTFKLYICPRHCWRRSWWRISRDVDAPNVIYLNVSLVTVAVIRGER